MTEFLNVRVDQLVESRWQPREGIGDPVAFEALAASVKMRGVKDPLKAFVNEEGAYELITGHRRRRAAIKAGLTHVPLIVVPTPKDEAGLRALREEVLFDNLLHEPLTPLEEARAFKALQEEEGYSIRQMAERLGTSKDYIDKRLALLRHPEDVQEMVSLRSDTILHAREIAKTVYVSVPDRPEESIPERGLDRETEERTQSLPYKHVSPAIGAPTAAGQHCPHCGDGRGREICNVCGRSRWIIAFDNIEDYQRALALVGTFIQR
jgi:ParB family chromosome partitioning protein